MKLPIPLGSVEGGCTESQFFVAVSEKLRYIRYRICPGRHLASATVWLTIATVLALFDIRRKKDASGRDTPIESDFTSGTVV